MIIPLNSSTESKCLSPDTIKSALPSNAVARIMLSVGSFLMTSMVEVTIIVSALLLTILKKTVNFSRLTYLLIFWWSLYTLRNSSVMAGEITS